MIFSCLHCFLQRHPSGQRLKGSAFPGADSLPFLYTFSVFGILSYGRSHLYTILGAKHVTHGHIDTMFF